MLRKVNILQRNAINNGKESKYFANGISYN